MDQLTYAIHFAAVAHRNQRRKDDAKTPYINHPIEVMHILAEAGITDIDVLSAAILHDTIEDTNVTYDQLLNEFGSNVAYIVQECSDDKSLPKEVRKQQQIIHAKQASLGAKLVKAADKLSNLRSLSLSPPTKWAQTEINGYFTWSYAVWLAIKGNNYILDKQLAELFEKKGFLDLDETELNIRLAKYYENIKESE